MKGNEPNTSLQGRDTIAKDDPRIALRGEIDSLYARAVHTCAYARQYGYTQIQGGLEDMIRVVRELMRAEALGDMPQVEEIMGMGLDEVRHVSHHATDELGLPPYMPDEYTNEITALVNLLRAEIRRTERAAVSAGMEDSVVAAIQLVLNRLSSAAYILMLESAAQQVQL